MGNLFAFCKFLALLFIVSISHCKKEEESEITDEDRKDLEFKPLDQKVQQLFSLRCSTGEGLYLNFTDEYAAILKAAKDEKGKMEMDKVDRTYIKMAKDKESVRAGTSNTDFRWPYEMAIQIDPSYDKKRRNEITAAIQTLTEAMKCFKFLNIPSSRKLRNTQDNVYIKQQGDGCYSQLGRRGGRQEIVLSKSCFIRMYGSGMHEIMHALGFFHEFVRPDRDKFVKIDLSKIPKGPDQENLKLQYEVRPEQKAFSPEYDFESIMHYQFNNVMQPKKKLNVKYEVGHANHLSKTDIARLQKMYPCKTIKGKLVPALKFNLTAHPGQKLIVTKIVKVVKVIKTTKVDKMDKIDTVEKKTKTTKKG